MFKILLASLLIASAPPDWRSPEFQKAKSELQAQMDKRSGNGVILELTRTSPTECGFLSEMMGEGAAWTLVAIPKSDLSKTPKAIDIESKDFEGWVKQTRPVRSTFQVPRNESEMTFVMTTKRHEGAYWIQDQPLMWVKKLPMAPGETKVMVFYVPGRR